MALWKVGELLCGIQKRFDKSPFDLAERVGFEPTVGLHLRLISSQVHSTTLPPLHSIDVDYSDRITSKPPM